MNLISQYRSVFLYIRLKRCYLGSLQNFKAKFDFIFKCSWIPISKFLIEKRILRENLTRFPSPRDIITDSLQFPGEKLRHDSSNVGTAAKRSFRGPGSGEKKKATGTSSKGGRVKSTASKRLTKRPIKLPAFLSNAKHKYPGEGSS